MKLKLDENFSVSVKHQIIDAGFEVDTVVEERLSGSSDEIIFDVCKKEQRCLMTFDLDFTDVIRFSPKETNGVIVFRFRDVITITKLQRMLNFVLNHLKTENPEGKLWVVEVDRMRIYDPKLWHNE